MKRLKYSSVLPPLIFGAALILLLQCGVIHKIFNIKILQLPLPLDIAAAFTGAADSIPENAVTTLVPSVTGLALGSIIGYAAALLATAFPDRGYGGLFIMTMINSVPIVALAPLMNRWFENDFAAKLAVITIVVSGIMAVNAFRGLNDLPENGLELMKANGSSASDVFIKLRIPNSLPAVFTALKIGVSSAMLATIISEFFSSETSGMGYMIKYTLKVGNMKQLGWAYIAAISILSIIIYGIICMAEKRVTGWHVSQQIDMK
ncbi:MAG: ABC transporter permease subunit [Bacillota bacterium]|nr:ABC transporter permease subunit [Bacillota bacterium]